VAVRAMMQVCAAAIVAFGAAPNYGLAIFARFCGGFFNGITGQVSAAFLWFRCRETSHKRS